jgi:hypothetical protein
MNRDLRTSKMLRNWLTNSDQLRWTESPPQIMKYVNEALRGMWHEVALGETGSLVVQNIFENCLEEDKVCKVFAACGTITIYVLFLC